MNLKTAIFVFVLMCIRYHVFGTITLKEVNGSVKDGAVSIHWITLAELNNKKFVVERSDDCQRFCPVGELSGETNSTTEKKYSFVDANPLKGISYYRIVSVDNSNSTTASQIIIVDNRRSLLSNNVFPCPFRGELNVVLNPDELPANSRVVVYGSSGRAIYSCEAASEVKLDLSYLQKGTYYITVENENKRLIEKKVLKNEE
jgi:trimeric autotransporter adhesin